MIDSHQPSIFPASGKSIYPYITHSALSRSSRSVISKPTRGRFAGTEPVGLRCTLPLNNPVDEILYLVVDSNPQLSIGGEMKVVEVRGYFFFAGDHIERSELRCQSIQAKSLVVREIEWNVIICWWSPETRFD